MRQNTKHGLTIRGDSLYCPLPLSLEPYWWCEPNCYHCYFRGLNHVWGKEERPISLKALESKLSSGLKNKNPKTPLAHCLKNKKTIRIGNKTDPYQPLERQLQLSTQGAELLIKHKWSFVIQTRFTSILKECAHDVILKANKLKLITLLPIISPGLEKDWELFERKRTTPIDERIKDIKNWVKLGIPLGINGEPFIPGHHTLKDFEETLKLIKSAGVNRYNTYNFHFTPFVAKRIGNLPGVDIEKIWRYNQDFYWKRFLGKLIGLSEKHDVILGCPDFVNSGPQHIERANTCCGIDVPNPTTFNTHYFKKLAQEGHDLETILTLTNDGSAGYDEALGILNGTRKDRYALKDAGVLLKGVQPKEKERDLTYD